MVLLASGGVLSALAQVKVAVQLKPMPPQNVAVFQVSPTQVDLTWEASPSLPASIDSYHIFYKLKTQPNYPLLPQIVRYDSLPIYSELIPVDPDTGYDFKIFANAVNGLSSSADCPSCEISNALCGNTVVEPGENCDLTQLAGLSCSDFNFSSGTLTCSEACQFDFSSCTPFPSSPPSSLSFTAGGGGGGRSPLLQLPPQPGLAVSPKMVSTLPILIPYSGAKAIYPKRLSQIQLYYKKNEGPWIDSGLRAKGESGQFEFGVGGQEAVTYAFALKAYDNFGVASPPPTGEGDTRTFYNPPSAVDTQAPLVDSLFLSLSADGKLILIRYRQARDLGFSGLKQVELWYKKGEAGTWTFSGLKSAKASDLFTFNPSSLRGTYSFALVLEDQAGNRSEAPEGEGQGNVVFTAKPFQATVEGAQGLVMALDTLTLSLGGEEIVAYKYQLNNSPYSAEIPVEEELVLSKLKEGDYTLKVIGKNVEGLWQDVSSPTLYPFRVDFSQPHLTLSGPDPEQILTSSSSSRQVIYTLKYTDFDSLDLDLEDIVLIKTGTAKAMLILSQMNPSTFWVTLSEISGLGTLRFRVLPHTARHRNGNLAPGLETRRYTLVNLAAPPEASRVLEESDPSLAVTPPVAKEESFELFVPAPRSKEVVLDPVLSQTSPAFSGPWAEAPGTKVLWQNKIGGWALGGIFLFSLLSLIYILYRSRRN